MKKIILALALFLSPSILKAACHAVGPTATGTFHDGRDYNNLMALPSPTAWIRGDTYYLIAGTYGAISSQTPNSGTTVITIKRAWSGDNGSSCTPSIATGYVDATMGQPAGPATFPSAYNTTRYWVYDGGYHPTPWPANSRTTGGFGFYINNSIGCSSSNCWAFSLNNGEDGNFVTIRNMEIKGHGPAGINSTPNRVDDFFRTCCQAVSDFTFQYLYLHDSSSTFFKFRSADNILIENVAMNRNAANAGFHSEAISDTGGNNVTVRYNIFENTEGTAAITWLNAGTPALASNWSIYGNLFYIDIGEPGHGWGNGVISCINGNSISNLNFFNNTIANIQSSLSTRINIPGSSDGCPTQSGIVVKDNLWYNSVTAAPSANSYTGFDYNSYLNTPTANDVGAQTIVNGAAPNPFINTNGLKPTDFFLFSNTNATPFTSTGSPAGNATDMLGVTRSLSRGTFEFVGGTAPAVGIIPASVTFASVAVGSSSTSQNVTLTNTGTATLTIASVSLTGANAADFVISSNNCGTSLVTSASCVVGVAFRPTVVGARTANLSFFTNAATSPNSVILNGTGASSISIPSVPTGLAATSSGSTVNLTWTASTGSPTGYKVSRGTVSGGPYTLIATTTTPTASYSDPGLSNNTYYYVVAAYNSAGTSANSTQASAIVALTPSANLSPTVVNFPVTVVGVASSPITVTLTNNGTDVLSSIVVNSPSGANAADFAVSANTCPGTLGIGISCTFQVTFTPSLASAEVAAVVVTSNDPTGPDTVTLSGTGQGNIVVSPTSLNFGNVFVKKTSAAQIVTYRNQSGASVTFTSVVISTGDSTQFTVSANTCTGSLANGAQCTVSVTFNPTTIGNKSSSLVITDNATGSPHSIALTGRANGRKVLKVGAIVKYNPPGGVQIINAVWRGRHEPKFVTS